MAKYKQLAKELVCLWVERSVGSQESFGYVISVFLKDNPLIVTREDIEGILSASKKIAEEVILQYPHDIPLNLSHKAFSSALDNFISCLN